MVQLSTHIALSMDWRLERRAEPLATMDLNRVSKIARSSLWSIATGLLRPTKNPHPSAQQLGDAD